jgi:hypothetical protein
VYGDAPNPLQMFEGVPEGRGSLYSKKTKSFMALILTGKKLRKECGSLWQQFY